MARPLVVVEGATLLSPMAVNTTSHLNDKMIKHTVGIKTHHIQLLLYYYTHVNLMMLQINISNTLI